MCTDVICVCASACMYVCMYVCVTVYHFVKVLVLLEVIFSHDSVKTLSFDHHLLYREQVNNDIKDGLAEIKE